MNIKLLSKTGCVAGLAAFGLMACSESNVESPAALSSEKSVVESPVDETADFGAVSHVNQLAAQSRMVRCARSVVSAWNVDELGGTLTQNLDPSFAENSFGVEAEAILEKENGYMTLASAGVDGDQDAWALRVENGKAMFAWRDASTGNQWYKVEAEGVLALHEVITVRAERIDDLTALYVNGVVVAAAVSNATIEDLNGHFTIGFDPTEETENMPGRVVMVRFGVVHDVSKIEEDVPTDSVETDAPLTLETVAPESSSSEAEAPESSASEEPYQWIAAWEFNDSEKVGKDFTGHGHEALPGEGNVSVNEGVAVFDGESGMRVQLTNDLNINSFVVEAKVKPSAFGTMQNILVAEPPGCFGDGWMLRADEGYLTVHFRDQETDGTQWTVFTGKKLTLGQWNEIRVERSNDQVKVFQDGELTIDEKYTGDVSQMTYDWGLGYDAMEQDFHGRYFQGEMDYVRFGTLEKMSDEVVKKESPFVLLADWEFNEPAFPGLDKMGNNSPKSVVGNANIEDGALVLDGKSGIPLNLSSTFLRNEFAVDVRLKASAFGEMQNVIVAEPPGRYGDGWMIRVDDGKLTVHLRDESTHGIEWQVFTGKALELDQWTEVRVIRTEGSIKVYQDGELTVDEACSGDVSQLGYDLGIGFDAVYQMNHDRFFQGSIDYIRYYGFRK